MGKLDTARYTLKRHGLLPHNAIAMWRQRLDKTLQATVLAPVSIAGRAVLQATYEITNEGRIRLAYDNMTGEALTVPTVKHETKRKPCKEKYSPRTTKKHT